MRLECVEQTDPSYLQLVPLSRLNSLCREAALGLQEFVAQERVRSAACIIRSAEVLSGDSPLLSWGT